MVMESNKQSNVCKNYAKSLEKLDDTKSFKLLSTNTILMNRVRGFVSFKFNQRRRHFNVLNLFKPGEILDSVFYKKELI